jgi:hypothetical protein
MQEFLTQHNDAAGDAHASTAAAAAASEAAAAAAENVQLSEPLSLWHEMQKRQQAEEAALESELSTGPGLQGPGGIFGEDLWMFDGGLFADEGGRGDGRTHVQSLCCASWNVQQHSGRT